PEWQCAEQSAGAAGKRDLRAAQWCPADFCERHGGKFLGKSPALQGSDWGSEYIFCSTELLFLHSAERQAAFLLGRGGGPAGQNTSLQEQRGRGARAAAVRASDRSRNAGTGARGRHRPVECAGGPERASTVLPVRRDAAKGLCAQPD